MCEGCQLAVDLLNTTLGQYSEVALEVCVVLSGPKSTCDTFLKLFPLHVRVTHDGDRAITDAFGVRVSPSGLLYDEKGLLFRKGMVWKEAELRSLLEGVPMVDAVRTVASS
jgi:hypothetical protein